MKRKRKTHTEQREAKRQETAAPSKDPPTWPLLRQYYPQVLSLRQYLASKLSGKRRKKVLQYGLAGTNQTDSDNGAAVRTLLDTFVVGTSKQLEPAYPDRFDTDLTVFTQHLTNSTAATTSTQTGGLNQCEIVDFTIWLLFRQSTGSYTPSHLLCRGFQRYASSNDNGQEPEPIPGLPGIWANTPNRYVKALKEEPWASLPGLLGRKADKIVSGLLRECGVFEPVEGSSNLVQICGVPLSDLKVLKAVQPAEETKPEGIELKGRSSNARQKERGLSDIQFVRSRMLYARPGLFDNGRIRFGLPHVHVLNRYNEVEKEEQTRHVLKYIFPRQFDLHNVSTSETDRNDTAQKFKDYTVRDQEISQSLQIWRRRRGLVRPEDKSTEPPLPKRLRNGAFQLINRLRKRHSVCSYASMLNYYCPRPKPQDEELGTIQQATPAAQVSAFCRKVICKVFPADFWGTGETRDHNRRVVVRNIDRFVRLRRYESLSLHDCIQRIKVQDIPWLSPTTTDSSAKLSATDLTKRKELMAELLYYLIDSYLIPLLRGHFHITESGTHRNALFYFRHDVWKSISEPALNTLKATMLEPCKTADIKKQLSRRALGVSHVRLLPKQKGMRPIINLRRRVQKMQYGQLVLGKSINALLTPAFSILNYEKGARPEMLKSAMFSVEDMFPRLQAFRSSLQAQGLWGRPLYFAKVDVKACFDTIPQKRLMKLAKTLLGAETYRTAKYSRSKLVGHNDETPGFGARPSWRFLTKATTGSNDFDFADEVAKDTSDGRTRTIYVDGVVQKTEQRRAVLNLLEEHVESNLIKLGNRFYRQKEGIPQGSIVSSLLCSFFYSELERQVLGYLNDGQSLLLRLIDDFLVITTKQEIAERFMRDMHAGLPEFGVEVKAEKSRVNFDMTIKGTQIPKVEGREFPYCGNAINTATLDLSKDKERRKATSKPSITQPKLPSLTDCVIDLHDSMSVEYSKLPGQTFYRKTLTALKLQMQPMLLSTAYNRPETVLANLYHCFSEVAMKSYHYIRSLPGEKQPGSKLLIRKCNTIVTTPESVNGLTMCDV